MLKSGWVSNGENVRALEQWFIKHHSVKYALACCNATTGLTMAVKAAGWSHDFVNIPAFTWPSTKYAAEICGNYVSQIDIHNSSWTMKRIVTLSVTKS
jgi:dTDP-4-amino-4,6-dideoxygalactose transaminase